MAVQGDGLAGFSSKAGEHILSAIQMASATDIDLDKLAPVLQEHMVRFSNDYMIMEYAMARRIIEHFLGKEWFDEHGETTGTFDPWMQNRDSDDDADRIRHTSRVVGLGDHLFLLRQAGGFDALLARFKERATKPCYIEAEIAAQFVLHDFHINIVKESGRRGHDFDFSAYRDGQTINVEVTSKETDRPSSASLRNTLMSKRDQVPNTEPAVLYIQLPDSWTNSGDELESISAEVFPEFFRRSSRFNAILFVWEPVIAMVQGGASALVFRSFICPSPRHPIANLSFLGPPPSAINIQDFLQLLAVDPVMTMVRMASERHIPSFVSWAKSYSPSRN